METHKEQRDLSRSACHHRLVWIKLCLLREFQPYLLKGECEILVSVTWGVWLY